MNIKKILFDLSFIVIAAVILLALIESGLLEKNIRFSLIPILVAYYLGQYVERKTSTK